MTKLLTLLATVFYLTTFAQTNNDTGGPGMDNPDLNADTLKIAILPFDTAQTWIFKKAVPADLTPDDLAEIETIFAKCIDGYNIGKEKEYLKMKEKKPGSKIGKDAYVINTQRHKRQYIAVINEKGEKEVWINCFCNSLGINWKKEIISVEDGGNCFFNLKINLTLKKHYHLIVNGHA